MSQIVHTLIVYLKKEKEIFLGYIFNVLALLSLFSCYLVVFQDIHKDLETQIANFHDREDCILFPSCFDANAGLFETLLSAEDAIISDELNHASIIDGIRLCKAKRFRYRHLDMEGKDSCTVNS